MCGFEQPKERFKLADYAIYHCPECDLEFNANFPPKGTQKDSFSKEYYCDVQKNAFDAARLNYSADPSATLYIRCLETLEHLTSGRRVLDVGAGLGVFMKIASERGWQVEGIEISPYGSQFITKNYGFRVSDKSISASSYPGSSFDLITFWDVIEHVDAPKENLQKAHELLKPGGLLLISSDNYSSLIASAARIAYKCTCGVFRYPLQKTFTAYNKSYFKESGFHELLKQLGFSMRQTLKMHYPIEKLNLNPFEKIAITVLYNAEKLFRAQSQFLVIAQKT